MLEIRLIMDEKTNSNDKEKKRIYLIYCHFNRNNSAVSVLSPRGPDSCHKLTFYNWNYSANSAPLSDVLRLLPSHGLITGQNIPTRLYVNV